MRKLAKQTDSNVNTIPLIKLHIYIDHKAQLQSHKLSISELESLTHCQSSMTVSQVPRRRFDPRTTACSQRPDGGSPAGHPRPDNCSTRASIPTRAPTKHQQDLLWQLTQFTSTAGALAPWGCMVQRDLLLTSHPLACLTSSEDIQTTPGAHKFSPFWLEAATVRLAMHARCSTRHVSTCLPFETSKAYLEEQRTT